MERQLPLCTASTPARDTRLDDAQDGYGSPRTMQAAGIALRHAVGRPPTAPRHASRGFKEFLFLVGNPFHTYCGKKGTALKAGWRRACCALSRTSSERMGRASVLLIRGGFEVCPAEQLSPFLSLSSPSFLSLSSTHSRRTRRGRAKAREGLTKRRTCPPVLTTSEPSATFLVADCTPTPATVVAAVALSILCACALIAASGGKGRSSDTLEENSQAAAAAFIKANNLGPSVIQIENMLTGDRF